MAARMRKTSKDETKWRWYCYKFFLGDKCVYVGKGSGKRFNVQSRRFSEYKGYVEACFMNEADALNYELSEILRLAPELNVACMPKTPEPWKVKILPKENKDFNAWCSAIGTRQVAIRVILSKSWSHLAHYGIDVKHLLSKLDPWCEVFNGIRP